MRAHARLPRRTTSTCRSPRNRSSPPTSRRAHPAYACVRSVDKVPRNPPEKLASPTPAGTRNRWSGACAPPRGARLTSGRSGGGHRPTRDRRVHDRANMLAGASCLCSCIRTRLLNFGRLGNQSRETRRCPAGRSAGVAQLVNLAQVAPLAQSWGLRRHHRWCMPASSARMSSRRRSSSASSYTATPFASIVDLSSESQAVGLRRSTRSGATDSPISSPYR